ncbi:MAG TPA: chemotaxis protein CheA [Cytophagaceae bacterium]|nr:chemotaxis protein CheA [Cytophagaceae bacterium]
MDLFKAKFINEANDLVNNLEESVLALENDREDTALIEQIFRVMHTFKGSSNMFGFDKIGEFTHHLETIYDLIRFHKLTLNAEIFNITLLSVDHLKKLLKDEKLNDPATVRTHNSLLEKIIAITKDHEDKKETSVDASNEKKDRYSTYHISVLPKRNILLNGNNILYLIDDLLMLGEGRAIANSTAIPMLEKAEHTACYLSWEVFLATSEAEAAIREVFLFAEGECELKITCIAKEKDLFRQEAFVELLDQYSLFASEFNLEAVYAFLGQQQVCKTTTSAEVRSATASKESGSIKVSSDKLDELMNLVSELVTTQARLSLFSEQSHNGELNVIAENIEKISRRLRDTTFNICLVPIGSMHTRFKRLVRDLGNDLGKEVDFVVEGSETELDKTIIESITDPLLHIIRNSMDHGIEEASVRLQAGKPAKGKIMLRAYYSGANVHIELIDDGAGLDAERIRQKAIEKGLITKEEKLSKKEIFDLIFLPGFSTAEKVTGISGRGVGMDVVKRNITDIRGEIAMESVPGEGTKITIILPLTLSIIDGLLVRIQDTHFIIPLSVVEKCYEVHHEVFVNNYKELIVLEGRQVPYLYLRDEFGMSENCPEIEQVVVVKYEDKQIGVSVDSIVGEYQAVLKPLGKLYRSVQIISGATILGDGSVALVMDTSQMIKQLSLQQSKELVYEQ